MECCLILLHLIASLLGDCILLILPFLPLGASLQRNILIIMKIVEVTEFW